jgi:hypothetical protein
MKKIVYFLAVLFVLTGCDKYSRFRHLISFEGGYRDAWMKATYEVLEAEKHEYYTNLILAEMAKYPDGFFDKIGLHTVVIGKNYKYNNVYRPGGADNYNHILFVSIRDAYPWDQWRALTTDPNGDQLGYGGEKDSINYNPQLSGYITNYSTTGQWEDRSEIMAWFLTEYRNKFFIEKARNDELFCQKAVTLFTFYKERLNFNLLDEFLLKVNQ